MILRPSDPFQQVGKRPREAPADEGGAHGTRVRRQRAGGVSPGPLGPLLRVWAQPFEISIFRPLASAIFGRSIFSTPFSNRAVISSAFTVRGRVKERWNEP